MDKMPSSVVELRPNRHLLDHDFEGYKLNLQALPHYPHDLVLPVDNLHPDDVQYSFVHAKLFALHNHLVLDHWGYSFNYYYVDNTQQVRHITFENTNHTFQNNVVYEVPAHVARKSGHFNLSIYFPSNSLAFVSDGTGYLHLVDTGPRHRPTSENAQWQTINSILVLGEDKYFIIIDSRIQEKSNTEILHCLLQSVEQNEKHFNSVLTWVTFNYDGTTWNQMSFRQLQGKGIVHYAAIETSCNALYIASDNAFKFTLDSENEIKDLRTQDEPKKLLYTWIQSPEDISITLKLGPNFDRKQFLVDVSNNTIKISYAGTNFVDGTFPHRVDSILTTWDLQDSGQVDIVITKSESNLWPELIVGGDVNGEQILDSTLVEEVHNRLAHLCSDTELVADQSVPANTSQELEECDAPAEDTVLVRIDATEHQITHRIPLSVHQFIFSIRVESQEVPAIALRHDVDACIWQPYAQLICSDNWPMKHQGTLMAFGYVQSSKQNRKFVTCPPNFSYSVVCEATRHIFIYRNHKEPETQLRHRSASVMKPVKVGQQHVFNIDKYGEVLGINATNEYLFILTETKLVAIQIL